MLSEAKEKEDSETNSSNDKEQVIDRTAGPGDPNYCGSCYGAEESDSQCCNSCEEVEQAYLKKGWLFLGGNSVEQCVTEVDHRASSSLKRHEGCMVFGNVLVSKVSGNFHFAPGHGFQAQHTHVHDLSAFMAGMFNVSHSIDKLAFGDEYPGVVNPLDKTSKTIHVGGGIFQYYIKVVPTRYEFLNGTVIDTNQYSVTEHSTNVMNKEGLGLPGVFVFYEVSPIAVNFQEQSRSFGHFITQLCAIIGGVFTVAGIVDKIIYSSISKIQKARMGKFI